MVRSDTVTVPPLIVTLAWPPWPSAPAPPWPFMPPLALLMPPRPP